MNAVCDTMLRTSGLDMQDTYLPEMIDELSANISWVSCSTYHILHGSSPGATIFGRDMLFGILYLADWSKIGRKSSYKYTNLI